MASTCSCRSCSREGSLRDAIQAEALLVGSFGFREWAAVEGRELVAAFLAIGSGTAAEEERTLSPVSGRRYAEREGLGRFVKPLVLDDEQVEDAVQMEVILGSTFDPAEWAAMEARELVAEFLAIRSRAASRGRTSDSV